jgi:SAM-dependent methyltransferase
MARNQSAASTTAAVETDKFKEAMQRRISYRLEEDETPVGGLNPQHRYYAESGLQFFRLVLDHLKINKIDRVLEIGCGTGRVSAPFVKHLGKNYHGFDINRCFVEYCRTLGNNFKYVDVFHDDWNPEGKIDPSQVEFPYRSRQFSAVFAVAVFNHFRFTWFEHYLSEISRVLIKEGRLFMTLVVAKEPVEEGLPPFQFSHRTETEWYDYRDAPLYNVAFPAQLLRRALIKQGLILEEPIRYGGWNKAPVALTGYDVIIAQKAII